MRTQGSLVTRTRYDKGGRLSGKAIHYRDAPAEALPLLDKTYHYDVSDNLVAEVLTQTQRKGMSNTPNNEQAHLEQIIGRFHNLPHTGRSYTGVNRYGYDPNEQLQTVQQFRPDLQATQVEDFKYDKAGNLFDGPKLNGLIKHNRVLVYQDKRYRYDHFGRLCEKRIGSHRVQRFEYDAEQRLVCVEQEIHGEVERIVFGYDPLGRRISKAMYKLGEAEPVFRTQFHWQGLRLLQEVQSGLPSLYVYASSNSYEPLARIDGRLGEEEIQYFHTNLAGQPEQLTDEHGHTVWRIDYHGWGATLDEWHSPQQGREQSLRYQGQHLDRETGLHYNTFRFYDPNLGRFTTPDPAGLVGGINLYQYGPNTATWIDPLGLCRRGNPLTKRHMDDVRDQFLRDNKLSPMSHTQGGRQMGTGIELRETYLKPLPGGLGRKGGSYTDMTFTDAKGRTVYIQTVDKGKFNGMSQREWDNAIRITKQDPSAIVITVVKGKITTPGSLDTTNMPIGQVIIR
ncbi:putative deoxyribonuclease RhsC [compost metagenome]